MPDVDINALGDQIAGLTLKQAKATTSRKSTASSRLPAAA
jgi:hypothetical protein